MSHRKKKGLLTALAVTMVGSFTVACSSDKPSSSSTTSPSTNPSGSPAASTKTGPKYPASFAYWVIMDSDAAVTMKNMGEMGVYKQMEKITGTKVEFIHPPSGEQAVKDQFNLTMAGGKMPEVMYYSWKANSPDKLIKDGKILRLNEIIEKYAPNLNKMLNDRPDFKKTLTSDEGNIYVFPFMAVDNPVFVSHGLFVRKDWLDKLSIKPPTTIDEWEQMLIAFRDKDPNGNGKKDEIPYFYRQTDYETSFPFLGAYGITAAFFQEKGVVKYGPYDPRFKDYLTLMNRWYSMGLIDKDYLTTDVKVRDSKMVDDLIGGQAGWAASGFGAAIQLKKQQDPNTKYELVGLPFPVLKAGDKPLITGSPTPQWGGLGAAITSSAKNPEEIAAWLDYGYSPQGHIMYNFGIEGESYTVVNGKPTYTEKITKNPNKLSLTQALWQYTSAPGSGPYQNDEEAEKQWHAGDSQIAAMMTWAKGDRSKYMPSNLNADEQKKIASIMTDLKTSQDQMINKFIMGAEPLSKFDEYISTLKKLGIEDAIKIYQTQYDRYMARK
jgi:putative aldouronate transport system substrate-binding protein